MGMIEHAMIPEERLRLLKKDDKWKEELKKFMDVEVELNEEVLISGEDSLQVVRVKEIMKAFGRGFDFDAALDLLDEEYLLETMEIREFSGKSKRRQVVLKGRLIGTGGKTKRMIERDASVKIAIYGKTVSIIGKWDNLKVAKEAIGMILSGSKHNTVYRFLETQRVS